MNDIKAQLKAAYDADAVRRDSIGKQMEQWKVDIRQAFLELIQSESKRTIIELGAGAGTDALFFHENGFEILATDLSEEMVKKCQEKGLQSQVIDFYDLSSLGKTFDVVYSFNSLLHVPVSDLDKVLNNISDI